MPRLSELEHCGTQVSDIGALSGLSGLTSLRLSDTQVADVSFLLNLPIFASESARGLGFAETPASRADSRLDMLSRLPSDRCARETVQYLKGTHPDFRPPETVVRVRSAAERLADAAPVDLVEAEGRLDAVNPSPPQHLAPNERAQRLETLRHLADRLADMAGRAQFLAEDDKQSLAAYSTALRAAEPTYITLEGRMSLLRGALDDPEFRQHTDPRLVSGWRELVVQHDALGPLLVPEEDNTDIPDPSPDTDPAIAQQAANDLDVALREAFADGIVRDSVVQMADALTDLARASRTKPGLLKKALIGIGGVVSLIVDEAATGAGKGLYLWAQSPQAMALIEKLRPILARIVEAIFGA